MHLENKITELKITISQAKIVDVSRLSTDEVQIMSKVKLTNLGTNKTVSYTIVSESEANLKEGKISVSTPIAQGLMGKKVGESVEIKVPAGVIHFEIVEIAI